MPSNKGYIPGDHWVICDICGNEYRQSQMKKQWNGLVVCPQDYSPRHPQDFIRAKKDTIAAQGLVRPEPEDRFVTGFCTTRSSEAGEAIAGCAIVGYETPDIPTATF